MNSLPNKSIVFKKGVLNIFTDASIDVIDTGFYNACAGALPVVLDEEGNHFKGEASLRLLERCTNNAGEYTAIELGVSLAVANQFLFSRINLFSDSNIAVKTLREWIFSWVHYREGKPNVYYDPYVIEMKGSDGKVKKNQILIKNIINMICMINPTVCQFNIYHVKGHAKGKSKIIQDDFYNTNDGIKIPECDAIKFGEYNDYIDTLTRMTLHQHRGERLFITAPFAIIPTNMNLYHKIIGGRSF